jgi:Protein kinase domain
MIWIAVPSLPLNPTEQLLLQKRVPHDARAHVVAARTTHRRAYVKWTSAEDAMLRRLFMDGYPPALIAQSFERNLNSVEVRLKRLGLTIIKPPKPSVTKLSAAKPASSRRAAKPAPAKLNPPRATASPRVVLQAIGSPCPYCAAPVPQSASSCPMCGAWVSGEHPGRLAVGTKLRGGRYTVGKILGEGGFGITYMGANVAMNARVAIKEFFPTGATRHGAVLIPPRGVSAQAFAAERDKCLEEARRLARFKHPSIVGVSDAFAENDTVYLVMEYLPGETLERIVRRDGPLELNRAVAVAVQLLDALAQIHATGLLHRDIKPDNIMLMHHRAALIDFGAAREFQAQQTQLHSLILTPGYAPLEQYGSHVRRSASSDLYALAGTLYFALTGRVPPAATERINGAQLAALPNHVVRGALGLAEAITAALRIRIEERPQSAREMIERIQWQPHQQPSPRSAAVAAVPDSGWLQRLLRRFSGS